MCGRYVTKVDAAIERYWSLIEPWPEALEQYNVVPSSRVPVVVMHSGRVGVFMRWGLVPFWAKGAAPKYSTINARAETLATAASYRGPWARRQRCILPALGFYEWKPVGARKQPYFIRLAGGEPFGLAGLWDRSVAPTGEATESCTIVTVPANPLVGSIHAQGRMPAIVTPLIATTWLAGSESDARALLAPYPAELMDAYPVSTRVNSPRNEGPELIVPVHP